MGLRRDAAWGVLDQVLVSSVHFCAGLVVLRFAAKEGYGAYVLGWAILLLGCGYQNALITTQMTVRAAALAPAARDALSRRFLLMQWMLYAPLAALSIIAVLVASEHLESVATHRELLVALSLALPGVVLREFARSYQFMRLSPASVLNLDLLYAAVLAASIALALMLAPREALHVYVVLALGLAGLASGAFSLHGSGVMHGATLREALDTLRVTLRHGLWSAGGVTVTHLQSQNYVYVLSATNGLSVTADAGAARLFMMPASLLAVSLHRIMQPRWVTLKAQGDHAQLRRSARGLAALQIAAVLAWAMIVIIAAEWLLPDVLGDAYDSARAFIIPIAVITLAEAMRSVMSALLQVHTRFRDITLANTATLIATVLCAPIAVSHFGPPAALWTQAVAELCFAGLLYIALRATQRSLATQPG